MVVPRKYQFRDLVNCRFFSLLGTLAMAMTSLNETICIAVMMPIMYMCPENIAIKKPMIMTNVHTVLVIMFCFFFSCSVCRLGSMDCKSRQHQPYKLSPQHRSSSSCRNELWGGHAVKARRTSAMLTSGFPFIPALTGLPGSEGPSLTSDMLGRLSLALLPRCWNWTFRRDFAIVDQRQA